MILPQQFTLHAFMKKKLVFISNMAAPYQIKFCYGLQPYFNAEFWFHVQLESNRQSWWKIELGEKCKILSRVCFKKLRYYLSLDILRELQSFDPDIVMLGGFTFPSNIISYFWAKYHKKKTIVFSEVNRTRSNVIRKKGIFSHIISIIYRNVDAIFTSSEEATIQFTHEFGFSNCVHTAQYAADIDMYLSHQYREAKKRYTFIFANRLTSIYNPILAIEIFAEIGKRYPGSRFRINASGELLQECKDKVRILGLSDDVEFLENIKNWDDLPEVYRTSDILILPALSSAGNFTILEAMASGMGIVVSDKIYGSGTYIDHGVNGFRCRPNREEFIESIEQYIHSPELLKKHALINKERAKQYTVSATARLFNALIRQYVLIDDGSANNSVE